MNKYWILDDNRQPVEADLMTWARSFENGRRHIGKDEIGDVLVSTVFLGIDHSFGGGPPILFETMVFGGPLDQEQVRYATLDEAEVGHAAMLERVRAGV